MASFSFLFFYRMAFDWGLLDPSLFLFMKVSDCEFRGFIVYYNAVTSELQWIFYIYLIYFKKETILFLFL